MRRLALLFAGGALWLVLAALPASADGGPHQLALNNGTAGLNADCAACHRAHTAQAADILKADEPALCTNCHGGTGATADVQHGVQMVPAGMTGAGSTMGALRGGGFQFSLINSAAPKRLEAGGNYKVILGTGAAVSVTVNWPAGTMVHQDGSAPTAYSAGSVSVPAPGSAANATTIETAIAATFGTSTTYSGSLATGMTNLPNLNHNVTVAWSATSSTYTFTFQNEMRLSVHPNWTMDTTGSSGTWTFTATTTGSGSSAVPVLGAGVATSSTHTRGLGTVWGNGPQGIGTAGTVGVVLDCTKCHNPHGNGQYRILNTLPGEDWSSLTAVATTLSANVVSGGVTSISVASATGFPASGAYIIQVATEQMRVTGGQGTTTWTVVRAVNGTTAGAPASGTAVTMLNWWAPATAVEVKDGAAFDATHTVRNYTVLPAAFAEDVVAAGWSSSAGDYFRRKYDPSGHTNFTNFYLGADEMNTGWNGVSKTNKADNAGVAPANSTGLMTAWCITCHTRYNGYNAAGTTSLVKPLPEDAIFMFRHGTTRIGCEQCHVSHGSNAAMPAPFSSTVRAPGSTTVYDDSALLKVDNRGTCQLCHDPTATTQVGQHTGTMPTSIAFP